jgi:hypothetical protein
MHLSTTLVSSLQDLEQFFCKQLGIRDAEADDLKVTSL